MNNIDKVSDNSDQRLLEVLGSFLEVGRAHHVASVNRLGALAQEAICCHLVHHGLLTIHYHWVVLIIHHRLDFPFNLELSDSGLFNQNVSGQSVYVWHLRRVLIQLRVFIEVVDIVANSEEFLVIVRASEENGSDSDDVTLGDKVWVWGFSLIN